MSAVINEDFPDREYSTEWPGSPEELEEKLKKEKKVAIVGGAPTTQMMAPFDDDSWNIWVLGNQLSCYDGKRISKIFEIHRDLSDKPDDYPAWLVEHAKGSLVVREWFPIEGQTLFPTEEAKALVGFEALSSSISYMFAYAILEGATEIAIYGVDMATDDHEYFKQRPGLYALIGYAKGKGIKVTIPEESPLMRDKYDEGRDWGEGMHEGQKPFTEKSFNEAAQAHQKRIESLTAEIDNLIRRRQSHIGAKQIQLHNAKIARSVAGGNDISSILEVTNIEGL